MNESVQSPLTKYKRLIFAVLAILIVLLILAFTRNNSFLSQLPRKTVTPVGHTTLFLSPSTITQAESPTTLDVVIDSGTDAITAVQLEVTYDPQSITDLSLQSGDFLGESLILPLSPKDASGGKATFVITPKNIQEAKSGKGVLAKIVFYPIKSNPKHTTTTISIAESSLVSARGVSQSVLRKMGGATITLPQ